MKIKLKEIDGTSACLTKIQEVLNSNVGKSVFFDIREHVIAFHCLRCFNIKKTSFKIRDVKSIELACIKIMQRLGIYANGVIQSIYIDKKDKDDSNPIHHFIKHVIGFHRSPLKLLEELNRLVKSDLKELLALIDEYEKDEVIVEYNKGIRRNEHYAKVRIDFYGRCLKERDKIVKHLTNNLEDRALKKAQHRYADLRSYSIYWTDEYLDRPYIWHPPSNVEYFDYKKINTCGHRLNSVPISSEFNIEELYNKDKALFYKKLEGYLSPDGVFQQINNYYVRTLPKIAEREPVFKELHALLKVRKWYGFTALALTQVEGIFSDMLDVLHPQKPYSSLPNKVMAVREYYNYAHRNFDYFEYCLPDFRNSFLHSGSVKDRNFKFLALDLLYDMHYLMHVFHELNDPNIELRKLLKKDINEFIHGIESFNYLFNLVKKIREKSKKHSKKKEILEVVELWNRFEEDTLTPSGIIEHYAAEMNNEITFKFHSVFVVIRVETSFNGHEIDLAASDMRWISENIGMIKSVIQNSVYSTREEIEYIWNAYNFLSCYKDYLPNCPKEATQVFDNVKNSQKINFAKVRAIKDVLMERFS